jgi:hypothetical protein
LLVSWCAGAAWCAATRTVVGVGDLVYRIGDGRTGRVLGGRAVGWCRVRSAPCTRSVGFLVEPQNQGQRFMSGLVTKPLGWFFIDLGLKTDSDGL